MTPDDYQRFCEASSAIPSWLTHLSCCKPELPVNSLPPKIAKRQVDLALLQFDVFRKFLEFDVPIIRGALGELCDLTDETLSHNGVSGTSAHDLSIKLIDSFHAMLWIKTPSILEHLEELTPIDFRSCNVDLLRENPRGVLSVCEQFGLDHADANRLSAMLERERRLLNPAGRQPVEVEPVGKSTNQPKNVNARMLEKMQADKQCHGWTCIQWAECLDVKKQSITATQTWRTLLMTRERLKSEKALDRNKGARAKKKRRAKD